MRKIFLIFFVVFLTIYSSVHFYVLGRLFFWGGWPLDAIYHILVWSLTISFFFASGLEQKFSHWVTNVIYMVAATWMGMIAILLVGVLAGELLVHFLAPATVVRLILLFAIVFTVAGLFHAQRPKLRTYRRKGSVNLRLGLLTDIHLGPVHGKRYAEHIVERLKKENVDFLLLGGDIIDGPGELQEDILTPFDKLGKPVYMSWGNHEHYLGGKNLKRVLKPTNIQPLRDQQVTIKGATLIGIDDAEDTRQVAKHLPKFKKGKYTILLYHRPVGLDDAEKFGVDLMLSGHTHKGQIFPFTILVKARFPKIAGWYRKGKTWLYVSTGAGTWGPPLRFGSRSEIVIIDVHT